MGLSLLTSARHTVDPPHPPQQAPRCAPPRNQQRQSRGQPHPGPKGRHGSVRGNGARGGGAGMPPCEKRPVLSKRSRRAPRCWAAGQPLTSSGLLTVPVLIDEPLDFPEHGEPIAPDAPLDIAWASKSKDPGLRTRTRRIFPARQRHRVQQRVGWRQAGVAVDATHTPTSTGATLRRPSRTHVHMASPTRPKAHQQQSQANTFKGDPMLSLLSF